MNEIRYRTITLELGTRDKDKESVTATLSTETPVERGFGLEVLSHAPGAVDLSRAKNGLPLLWQHNPEEIIGRVSNIHLENRKLKGELRPGNSARAKELWNDVRDGVIKDVSIGYHINGKNDKPVRDGDKYIFKNWTVYETSLVSIGADALAGIGRSQSKNKGDSNMDNKNDLDGEEGLSPAEKFNRKYEREYVGEIWAIAEHHKCLQLGKRAISEGWSVDQFKKAVLDSMPKHQIIDTSLSGDVGISQRDISKYSIVSAVRAMLMNDWRDAGLEREVSQEIERKTGKRAQGLYIPFEALKTRALSKGTPSEGGYLVETTLLADNFIEALRNKANVIALGATVLNGLRGDVAIPKQTAAATAYWVAEGSAPTASQQTFGQVTLNPKTVGAITTFTRKLMLQSSPAIEQLVRDDLMKLIGVELDRAAINGSGASNQPTGILKTTGIGAVAIGTDGGAPAHSHIVGLESEVAIDNADLGALAYLTNAKVRGKLRQVFANATYGELPLWADSAEAGVGKLNGYKALVSNNVPFNLTKGTGTNLSAILFGNWADLLIGIWGNGLDILVDPYTNADTGNVRVRVFLDMDIAVRNAESFAAIVDAITT